MRIIAFANPKGGVGKTTLFDEVAFELEDRGYQVATVQLDNQGSAYHSTRDATDQTDFLLVDSPARPAPEQVEAIQQADLVVVPVMAGPRDLAVTRYFIESLTSANTAYGVVLNQHNPRTRVGEQLDAYVTQQNWPVLGRLSSSVVLKKDLPSPCGVGKHSPHHPVAAAIQAITIEIVNRAT